MKLALVFTLLATSSIGNALASDMEMSIDGIAYEDVVEIPTNKLLLRPLDASPNDVNFYCSPTWAGAVIVIDDIAVALNPVANKAAKKNAALRIDGNRVDFVPTGSKKSPLKNEPDTVARLVSRADRDCKQKEEPKPEVTAKAEPRRTKQENVLNHIAEVMVIDEMCDRLEMNTVVISMAANYNGVSAKDLSSGGKYHDKLVSLIQRKRSEMMEIEVEEEMVCMSGDLLYGKSGVNVAGFLVPSY